MAPTINTHIKILLFIVCIYTFLKYYLRTCISEKKFQNNYKLNISYELMFRHMTFRGYTITDVVSYTVVILLKYLFR